MRDDFSQEIKEILAKRVAYCCSKPNCRQLTSGPSTDPKKALNIGVAAHIMAASPGGKRYCSTQTPEERKNIINGIWLCQNCAKLIDSDDQKYTVDILINWKYQSEAAALLAVEEPNSEMSSIVNVNSEVVSINQSGGQTARTIINQKPIQRTLKHARSTIISELKNIEPIDYDIQILMNDMEANNLAEEIKEIFHNAGWTKGEIIRGMGGVHPSGITISRNTPTKQSEVITVLFINAGLYCAMWPELRGTKLGIYIGPNSGEIAEDLRKLQWGKRQF
jgi:hypothetical protein